MHRTIILAAACAGLLASPGKAEAKGCMRGAVAGALVGHYAGHHAVAGAMGGCIAARAYYKNRTKSQEQKAQATRQTAPGRPQ